MRLLGKVAIITGGSRGIGAAMASAFADEGAKVVIASRKEEGLMATAAEINGRFDSGVVFPKACHVGKAEHVAELVSWTADHVGLPTILVNNAGTNPYFGPMMGCEDWAWDKTFEVNLKGCWFPTREVVQRLQAAGQGGSIINTSSIFGLRAAPLQGVYGMTKAALISMTKTLAKELGHANIRVNAICPGLVETKLAAALVESPEVSKIYTERAALGRFAKPEEIAGLAVYLASEESSYVTGQHFVVDGGYIES